MKKNVSMISLIALLLAAVTLLSGCGASGSSGSGGNGAGGGEALGKNSISGNDAFNGMRGNEILWGHYQSDIYNNTGSNSDADEFRKGMKYLTVTTQTGEKQISALPVQADFGQYTHSMSSFSYEEKIYVPYTETGRAMFRKAYMAEKGDLTEEEFRKIEQILQTDCADLVFVQPEGPGYMGKYIYEIEGNQISFYEFNIDKQYNVTRAEKPLLTCDFLHQGGKLILAYKGMERTYLTKGYKAENRQLSFSGYASNPENQYKDLEGFRLYRDNASGQIELTVALQGEEYPVDPVMNLDDATGKFTLSWTKRAAIGAKAGEERDDAQTVSGTIIPCENYGTWKYSGFFMFIDGTCYRYLMSEEEYQERRAAALAEAERLSKQQAEELARKKRDLLAELVAAFKKEGIEATVDYVSGQVALQSNVLFATDSYELSDKGKEYVNSFMKVYTSVVMREEYAPYVSKIVVEGHTDPRGSYSHNMTLSQNRANAVHTQCVDHTPAIASILSAQGCGYDYPVYNDNGSINMDRSRRVTFRFVLQAK